MRFGLIDNGKIIDLKEKDFLQEEREKICNVIENTLTEYINSLLLENKVGIDKIEKIGIAAPRKDKGWSYCESRKSRNSRF